VLDVRFPIDVVYTWVDGRDPAWLARRRAALSEREPNHVESLTLNARFVSRDELRYSMRSLAMYASWVRKIFLVTDRQVPPWLDQGHPNVVVVDHTQLFPDRDCLPTFNSHAIETTLHRIPGLAEHFLYFNDDVLVGRPLTPELFFWANGLPKFFPSRATLDLDDPRAGDAAVLTAAKNNRRLLADVTGVVMSNKLKHTPLALRRSLLFEMEEVFADDFRRTRASRFRHPDDISVTSSLAQWYGFATGRSVPGRIAYRYVNIGSAGARRDYARLLARRDFDVFCLNDTDTNELDEVDRARYLQEFLSAYYPLSTGFELPEALAITSPEGGTRVASGAR
jgi:hypothetical protein